MSRAGGWAGGHQGRSLRPFHVSQHHPSTPPPSSVQNPQLARRREKGPGGWPRPGGLAFVARWPAVARRLRGGGLTPRCIVRRGPPPLSPGSPKRSQRVPPPAAPTSPCGAQGPDVESSPRPARLSTTPPSAASLRPGLDSTRVVPAAWRARGGPCACKRRVASLRRSSGCSGSCRSRRAAGAGGAGARPGSMPAQPR